MAIKTTGIKKRGFGSMSPQRKKEISSLAGQRSQASGRGHKFNSETGKKAGEKGNQVRWNQDEETAPQNS
jgi:hypothetical protein